MNTLDREKPPGPSESRAIVANDPLWIVGPDIAWQISDGRVQVFAVETVGGEPTGPRHSFVQVSAGELIVPFPEDSPFSLLAVSLEPGTSAMPVPVESLYGSGNSESIGHARHLIETWVETVAQAVATPNPRNGVELKASSDPDATIELEEDSNAWPALRTIWVDGSDRLELFGTASLGKPSTPGAGTASENPGDREIGPGAEDGMTIVPIPENSWVRASSAVAIRVISGDTALSRQAGWNGLSAFHGAVSNILKSRFDQETVANFENLHIRGRLSERMRSDAYERLGMILEPSESLPPSDGSGDGLLAAFAVVGNSLGIVTRPAPKSAAEVDNPIEVIARSSGVRTREVALEGSWWRTDAGPLLGRLVDSGKWVALLQPRPGKYEIVDPETLARTRIDAASSSAIEPVATMVYRPLPSRSLTGKDVLRFIMRPLWRDLGRLSIYGLIAGAMSLVTPLVTKTIFSSVVPNLLHSVLWWLTGLMVIFAICSFSFAVAQQLATARLEGRSSSDLQAALWDRVLDLPLPFFRQFSSGNLTQRVLAVDQIRTLATTTLASAIFTIPVALFNLILAFILEPRLALFGIAALAVTVVLMILLTRYQVVEVTKMTAANRQAFGLALQLVDAVGKLRVANAEKRAFAQWASRFGELKEHFYRSQLGFAAMMSFTAGITGLATLLLFLGASTLAAGTLTGPSFLAFNTAFTQALAAVSSMATIAVFLSQAIPLYRSAKPILEEPREADEVRADPGELAGKIEINHITMRYAVDGPAVLDGVSFTAEPGEFVAIVGPSGAGKSSIMRILLGFEIPEVGSVRYDGKDLDSIDPRSVRRQLGVVTQSVRLLPGDIRTNIIGNRQLTLEDAWDAAEMAGIADDIKAMPMGMQTFVSEGASTFSGGQRQRLLIARAVAGKPRILLFDEATSALDNRTQGQVADAISSLRATRIVIAHRLSTIRNADKIIVLDGGKIVQVGSFDELMRTDGPFRRLAERQLA